MAGQCTAGIDTGFVTLGYAKIALLGVVQGITELLPARSDAIISPLDRSQGFDDPAMGDRAALARGNKRAQLTSKRR